MGWGGGWGWGEGHHHLCWRAGGGSCGSWICPDGYVWDASMINGRQPHGPLLWSATKPSIDAVVYRRVLIIQAKRTTGTLFASKGERTHSSHLKYFAAFLRVTPTGFQRTSPSGKLHRHQKLKLPLGQKGYFCSADAETEQNSGAAERSKSPVPRATDITPRGIGQASVSFAPYMGTFEVSVLLEVLQVLLDHEVFQCASREVAGGVFTTSQCLLQGMHGEASGVFSWFWHGRASLGTYIERTCIQSKTSLHGD